MLYDYTLGRGDKRQTKTYMDAHVNAELLKEIRESVNRGLALGNERFTAQIEALTDGRVTSRKAGRPKKIVENAN